VQEYDSRDRALVWRTSGGKHRWICGDCDVLVEDDVMAFREAAIAAISPDGDSSQPRPATLITLESLEQEHALLTARLALLPDHVVGDEAVALWKLYGLGNAGDVAEMNVESLLTQRPTGSQI